MLIELNLANESKLRENIEHLIEEYKKGQSSLMHINKELKYNIDTINIDLNTLRDDMELVRKQHLIEINEVNQESKQKIQKLDNKYNEDLAKCEDKNKALKRDILHLKEELSRCEEEIGDNIQINKILESKVREKEGEVRDLVKQLQNQDSNLNNENKKIYYQFKEQEVF